MRSRASRGLLWHALPSGTVTTRALRAPRRCWRAVSRPLPHRFAFVTCLGEAQQAYESARGRNEAAEMSDPPAGAAGGSVSRDARGTASTGWGLSQQVGPAPGALARWGVGHVSAPTWMVRGRPPITPIQAECEVIRTSSCTTRAASVCQRALHGKSPRSVVTMSRWRPRTVAEHRLWWSGPLPEGPKPGVA